MAEKKSKRTETVRRKGRSAVASKKIGQGISPEQLDLPAGFRSDGSRMATLREVISPEIPTVDFPQLAPEQKAELTAERIKRQPEFKLGMIGAGIIDKERAIQEVKAQSEIGKTLMEIEQRTITHLIKKATDKR